MVLITGVMRGNLGFRKNSKATHNAGRARRELLQRHTPSGVNRIFSSCTDKDPTSLQLAPRAEQEHLDEMFLHGATFSSPIREGAEAHALWPSVQFKALCAESRVNE